MEDEKIIFKVSVSKKELSKLLAPLQTVLLNEILENRTKEGWNGLSFLYLSV